MLFALLCALQVHVIWIHQTYQHLTNPALTIRVRLGCKLISLILTATLFSLIADWAGQLILKKQCDLPAEMALDRDARDVEQLVKILGGADNYLRYVEIMALSSGEKISNRHYPK